MTDLPMSLYLDLEPGEIPELEVVASAALAWASLIRHVTETVEPGLDLRIGFETATEGSLSLNSIIEFGKRTYARNPRKVLIAGAIIVALGGDARSWAVGEILATVKQHFWNEGVDAEPPAPEEVNRVIRPATGQDERRRLFSELDRERRIIGVGASIVPAQRPPLMIPRSEFPALAGDRHEIIEVNRSRQNIQVMRVVLVSPVLKNVERRWRFQFANLPEFSATMKDKRFLDALEARQVAVPMQPGTEMEIELETKEIYQDGVWIAKERNVLRVIDPEPGPSLPFTKR